MLAASSKRKPSSVPPTVAGDMAAPPATSDFTRRAVRRSASTHGTPTLPGSAALVSGESIVAWRMLAAVQKAGVKSPDIPVSQTTANCVKERKPVTRKESPGRRFQCLDCAPASFGCRDEGGEGSSIAVFAQARTGLAMPLV